MSFYEGWLHTGFQAGTKRSITERCVERSGCEKYFGDKMTGSKFERKGLEALLEFVRPGDTVIVWKLDRLGRSLKDLIETLNIFKDCGVDFISLTERSTRQHPVEN